MQKTFSPNALKVQQALDSFGLSLQVVELPASTRTAQEASIAIGCNIGQIVKSLVFKGKRSGQAIMVIASGANQVSEKKVEMIIGEPLGKADADFVLVQTGYPIGGVPPLGHIQTLLTLIDEDLLHYDLIWAAAGTPHAVFQLTPDDLLKITSGTTCDISK